MLDLHRHPFRRRPWLLPRLLAEGDERQRIPVGSNSKSCVWVSRNDVFGGSRQLPKHWMRAYTAKPVRGIAGVRLLAMQDRVPKTRFRRFQILHDFMTFIKAGKIKPQSTQGFSRGSRVRKQTRCLLSFQTLARQLRRTAGGNQWDQPVPALVEREDLCYLCAVCL